VRGLECDQEWRGVYLSSMTLRYVFMDQIEREHPVGAWRFGESAWLPCGAEAVLAPHEGELWIYVPGCQPLVTDATQFDGSPCRLALIIEDRDLLRWGCDNERRPRAEVRYEMWELRTANDEHQTRQLTKAINQKRGEQ